MSYAAAAGAARLTAGRGRPPSAGEADGDGSDSEFAVAPLPPPSPPLQLQLSPPPSLPCWLVLPPPPRVLAGMLRCAWSGARSATLALAVARLALGVALLGFTSWSFAALSSATAFNDGLGGSFARTASDGEREGAWLSKRAPASCCASIR
jgi:hypothetical protein